MSPATRRIDKMILRLAAKAVGLKRYSTGKACRNGHLADRLTSTGKCAECHRLRRVRRYRANPERERVKKRLYDERNRDLINTRSRAATAKNPVARRQATRRWCLKNPEKRKAFWSAYYKNNCERERQRARVKRAHRAAIEGTFTADDLRRIFKAQHCRCAICRIKLIGVEKHLDHIISIAKGGTNWPRNLQFLCRDCNLRKNAKDPLDFSREKGLLL